MSFFFRGINHEFYFFYLDLAAAAAIAGGLAPDLVQGHAAVIVIATSVHTVAATAARVPTAKAPEESPARAVRALITDRITAAQSQGNILPLNYLSND